MTEATVDNAAPGGLRHWLYVRWRLAYFTALLGLLLYLGRAVAQIILIRQETPLQDFPQYYAAALRLNSGGDPYATFLASCPGPRCLLGGYIYPPLLAELLRPLTLLNEIGAAVVWILLSHLMLAITAVVAYRTVRQWLPRGAAPLLLAASLLFLPIYQNLHGGQVGSLLLLILAIAANRFVHRGAGGGAGAALGLGAVLRVSPVAMTPLLLRTREDLRWPVGLTVMAATGGGLLGLLYLLTPTTAKYFRQVLPALSMSTGRTANLSLPGVLIRLQDVTLGHALPFADIADALLLPAGLALTWWMVRGLDDARFRAAAFAAFLAVLPVVSAITWNYHLVNELLVYTLLAPSLAVGGRAWWLAVASYPLLWLYGDGLLLTLGINTTSSPGTVAFMLVTSLNLVGALLLWFASLEVLAGLRRTASTPAG